jgi:hypothetical protein
MRRIMLLVTVGLVMALMVAFSGVASASHTDDPNAVCTRDSRFPSLINCVRVVEETVPAEQPCEVGNSGRMGTQEGTITKTTTYYTTWLDAPQTPHIIVGGGTDVEEGPFVATGPCRNIPGPPQ